MTSPPSPPPPPLTLGFDLPHLQARYSLPVNVGLCGVTSEQRGLEPLSTTLILTESRSLGDFRNDEQHVAAKREQCLRTPRKRAGCTSNTF